MSPPQDLVNRNGVAPACKALAIVIAGVID
jgi:hypothetical protein